MTTSHTVIVPLIEFRTIFLLSVVEKFMHTDWLGIVINLSLIFDLFLISFILFLFQGSLFMVLFVLVSVIQLFPGMSEASLGLWKEGI